MVGGGFLGKLHKQHLILYGFPRSRIILSDQGHERISRECNSMTSVKYSTKNTGRE